MGMRHERVVHVAVRNEVHVTMGADVELRVGGAGEAHDAHKRQNCYKTLQEALQQLRPSFDTMRVLMLLYIYSRTFAVSAAIFSKAARKRCSWRSEEHTSELQSLIRTSYADFRLQI